MALTDKLSAIGSAIREKTGGTELLTLDAMATAIQGISGGGDIPAPTQDELTFDTLLQNDWGIKNWFLNKYQDKIQTQHIRVIQSAFNYFPLSTIPFKINMTPPFDSNRTDIWLQYLCQNSNVETLDNVFVLPDDPSSYTFAMGNCFQEATCLRTIPQDLLILSKYLPTNGSANSLSLFYQGFYKCFALDELVGIGVPNNGHDKYMKSNKFNRTFNECRHLKRVVFEPNQTAEWTSQTIDLTYYIGYGTLSTANGFSSTKQIKDDATYQALKDDPDSWTLLADYARYNHDSAVETINSLPDTSAYLATAGGTNTIKFKGAQGVKTDGGAINTLTEEEIAVATAKGWTVSFV